jgi:hypothetical protein
MLQNIEQDIPAVRKRNRCFVGAIFEFTWNPQDKTWKTSDLNFTMGTNEHWFL